MKIYTEGNDKPLTKEQVEKLTKLINCKYIFGPSKPIKITTNSIGIWKRVWKENKDE